MEKEKNLYFVKMGYDYDEIKAPDMKGSDVNNYRIRGTFHDKENNIIFIEFSRGYERQQTKNGKYKTTSSIKLIVDHQYNKTLSQDENESHIKVNHDLLKKYNYTKQDILNYIFEMFGVKFDKLILIDSVIYNYDYNKITGDEFAPDLKKVKQVEKIKQYFYNFEKETEGKRFPNFSIYYENNILTVLKHYNCFNDIIKIDDIFKFDFNYKIPHDEIKQAEKSYYSKFGGVYNE